MTCHLYIQKDIGCTANIYFGLQALSFAHHVKVQEPLEADPGVCE